jgi:ubiquinone/menaquinone biosynthesis C-methylase UbiE
VPFFAIINIFHRRAAEFEKLDYTQLSIENEIERISDKSFILLISASLCLCGKNPAKIQIVIYDNSAKFYDKALAPFEKRFLKHWRKETLAYLPENANLLEIGAGTGLNFKHYPNCKHSVASEFSCQMLELAKEKVETPNLSLVQTNAETLPFAQNTFDAAFATLVFCAISNPEKAFDELKRVVKPNGKIVLLEHVRPKGLFGYLFDVLNIFTVALMEDHFNRETAKLAENSGLKILEVKEKAFGIVNLIVCEVVK